MKAILALATCGFFIYNAAASDWPQWGGPKRNHVSEETGLLRDWPSAGPKRLWLNRDAGLGYSGFAVAGGKIFTIGTRGDNEILIALDESDGKELWTAEIAGMLKNGYGDGPRGTPTVVGDRVFALGGQGTLVAASVVDGKVLWKKRMQELGGKIQGWGFTESVYADDQNVYCTPGGSQGAVAALDRKTGEVKWQSTDFTDPTQYSSLVPADINNTRQLVQLTMHAVIGVDAKNGKLLWKSDFPGRTAVIPTPVIRSNYVFVTAGYGAGCDLLKIRSDNQVESIYDSDTKRRGMKNHHGGVVLMGAHIYGYSDGPGWVCQEFLTGKEIWSSKKLAKGAVTGVGDRLYCLGDDGNVVLAEASPQGWREHGRFMLDPQTQQRSPSGKIWTHPVIANGRMYLRDQELLFCFEVAAPK